MLDERTAALCEPTPDGLAEAMAAVFQEPEHYAEVGAAARKRVEQEFSYEAFSRKLLAAYEFVLNR